ncbi:unnamed protein product [Linum trigynum]|uniref:Reverse transcriptase Ty1/copia-type domain-containing protein n=1 Tax=Linum trigynum TaxID=586398 RepID=A0AAV2FPG5_9ROSI
MTEEHRALLKNQTWKMVPRSPTMNVISCKWLYRIKTKSDDSIDRYKARLVARGFQQRPGLYFGDIFSPVLKPTTLRLIMSLVVSHKWPVRQLDIANAFLHGTLTDDVFMQQPPGFVDPDRPDHVCHLQKSLYGLKQAPRAWFHCLRRALKAYGFHGSKTDTSLFILCRGSLRLHVLIYVDDILITGNQPYALQALILYLNKKFAVRDLGRLSYFLGIETLWTPRELVLSQRKYINHILARAKMSSANVLSTPAATTTSNPDSMLFPDITLYRQIVGALQYLQFTRPDIA